MSRVNYCPMVIAAGGTKSKLLKLSGQQVVGFYTDSAIVGTTITFEMSPNLDAATILSLPVKVTAGTAVSFTVTTSGYYGFTADQVSQLNGIDILRVVSGSTETAGTTVNLALLAPPSK